jgi:hypothetical protein
LDLLGLPDNRSSALRGRLRQTCILGNFDSTKPAIIGSLVSDIALLLIMLIGLLRLRREAGGAFALGRTLWKQVRWWQFPLAVVLPIH